MENTPGRAVTLWFYIDVTIGVIVNFFKVFTHGSPRVLHSNEVKQTFNFSVLFFNCM